jgi:hypothetical protein
MMKRQIFLTDPLCGCLIMVLDAAGASVPYFLTIADFSLPIACPDLDYFRFADNSLTAPATL